MLRIGEKMSRVIDPDRCISAGGDIYESNEAMLMLKPLDTGRLCYVLLRQAIDSRLEVEVWWNHFNNVITLMVGRDDYEVTVEFVDPTMARTDLVERMTQTVQHLRERSELLLQ